MQVNIRIADDIYKKLRERAKNNRRTITAELDLILCSALETTEKDVAQNSINSNRNTIETTNKKKRSVIGLTMDTDTEGADNLWN